MYFKSICDVLKIKENKKRQQNPLRFRSKYKWIMSIVVTE
jgi:hypothetical protein